MREIKTGVELISEERQRQIDKEGWTTEHDATHENGELAMAACCYAAPDKIFVNISNLANKILFQDPFPFEPKWDKRYDYGENKNTGANFIPRPSTYTNKERIDLLKKAGALIAAEIDRINNTNPQTQP